MSIRGLLGCLVLAATVLSFEIGPSYAQTQAGVRRDSAAVIEKMAGRVTPAQRNAAAAARQTKQGAAVSSLFSPSDMTMPMPTTGSTPDYFGMPNWANSPLPKVDPTTGAISGGIRKFVDRLPGLNAPNNLGQMIPVAVADKTTYPGSDYYEIELRQYTEKMHSDLPPTTLRGYVQVKNGVDVAPIHYLGPVIVAERDWPVRIKFTNKLSTGTDGNLFIPVDTTTMGAGMGPIPMLNPDGTPMLNADGTPMMESYTQNRATLHLHGGHTPWISDGTPHQWITPAGESTVYPKGVSVSNVPDMPDPGDGSQTFFYSNQQSARLMFYHDHAYGITRLNVYAGEAAGYVITDQTEKDLIASGVIPSDQIPLIIQDKTFVPDAAQLAATDPTWQWGSMPGMTMTGDLWFPHVYMPNQNPYDDTGANPYGRWDYGPWFWPPLTTAAGLKHGEVPNPYYDPINAPWEPPMMPGTPSVSMVMEAFMDTPVVNGTAYPFVEVERKAYRLRILNACNDRFLSLGLYFAKSNTPDAVDPVTGLPTLQKDSGEVPMVPAIKTPGFPVDWPTDGRDGDVPNPAAVGPTMIQIGTEGGFLPAPVPITNQPVNYTYNRRDIVVLNISTHALLLGPAERADVIVDFSGVPAGLKLILYNDAPAPVPALDPRIDYYTGNPDMTDTGGAPSTLPGYGPNTRTIMQFQVGNAIATPVAFNVAALNTALPIAFAASQPPMIVPEKAYGAATNKYVRIQDTSLTFTPTGSTTPLTIPLQPKCIQELFELDYGRMNSTLGVELPLTNFFTQTTIPLGYIDPATEVINDSVTAMTPMAGDGTQIWKVTHNGVDTHAIHFHLFDVQLVNRVGWDGAIRPPEPNELGWKDTVRMNPLEDAIVALRPTAPKMPFGVPDSIRALDPTMPLHTTNQFTNIDPLTNNPIRVTNEITNFGWEYVWHCHLLGHEEMDMMRPVIFNVARNLPAAPVLTTSPLPGAVKLAWTDGTPICYADTGTWGNPANEIGYRIERATAGANGTPGPYSVIDSDLANETDEEDTDVSIGTTYSYRVAAFNAAGESMSNAMSITAATLPGAPTIGTAVAGNAKATVGFSTPAYDGGAPITSYIVTASPGGATATGASSPITVTGLTNGTLYTLSVAATNAVGTGPSSGQSNSVMPVSNAPIIVDNADGPASVSIVGAWTTSTSLNTKWSANYIQDGNTGKGTKSVTFTPNLPTPGTYRVSIWYTADTNRATSVPVDVISTTGTSTVNVNERLTGGQWVSLGNYTFAAGTGGSVRIRTTGATNGYVVADAAQFEPIAVPGAPTIGTATASNAQAKVCFAPPASSGGGQISYTVTSHPGNITATGHSSPINVTGLTNGTTYTFAVTATNAAGTGPSSGQSNSVTPASTLPIIVDNADGPTSVAAVGSWTATSFLSTGWGTNYIQDGNTGKGTKSVTFTPYLPVTGTYQVSIWYTADTNRATAVPVDITSTTGTSRVNVNERINGGQWVVLGTYTFSAGTTGNVQIRTTGTTNGYVIADAVRFVSVP